MKRIRYLDGEPTGVRKYRDGTKEEEQNWEDFRSHDAGASYLELVESLVEVQRGLCGYCEIDVHLTDRQVEHVVPRSGGVLGRTKALDYQNMIACCRGGTRWPGDVDRQLDPVRHNQSCGQSKGHVVDDQFIDPREIPHWPPVIRVLYGGEVEPDQDSCNQSGISVECVKYTIEMLGLNAERLRRARDKRWSALNEIWAGDIANPQLMQAAAKAELFPDERNRLRRFFSTSRSYFDEYAEQVLSSAPDEWI